MSITCSTIDSAFATRCTSEIREHRFEDTPNAVLRLDIGQSSSWLCIECARKVFTAVGFMITSKTGESVAQLAGVAKGKRK